MIYQKRGFVNYFGKIFRKNCDTARNLKGKKMVFVNNP